MGPIVRFFTGDYGHEARYVEGAAAQNGHYSPSKHVERQCRDSDDRNHTRESRNQAVSSVVSGFLDWLAR